MAIDPTEARTCTRCGEVEGSSEFMRCSICLRYYCGGCEYRAYGGRKFCSPACGRTYYFHGDDDDNPNPRSEDD